MHTPEREWTQAYPPVPMQAPQQVVFPPPPGTSQAWNQAIEQQRYVNKNSVVFTSPLPIHEPPHKANQINITERYLIGVPAADADATAAVTTVLAALNRYNANGILSLTPTATTTWNTVISFRVREGTKAMFKGVGVSAHDNMASEYGALLWRITVNGQALIRNAQGNDNKTGEVWSAFSSSEELLEINLLAGANNIVNVDVQNLDTRSGSLVMARLMGWEFTVAQQDDSIQSLIPNMTNDTNGRFTTGYPCR